MIKLKYDNNGLIPAIIQDKKTKEVLMVAYMNRRALNKTLATRKVHFYSRSRNKLWLKGETSGHYQWVHEFYTDCDRDTLLFLVYQKGGACHLGFKSCFAFKIDPNKMKMRISKKKLFDPRKVYKEIQ